MQRGTGSITSTARLAVLSEPNGTLEDAITVVYEQELVTGVRWCVNGHVVDLSMQKVPGSVIRVQ